MKTIFYYTAVPLLLLAMLPLSCKDEPQQGDPWLQMTSATDSFVLENDLTQLYVTINSNRKWTLDLEFDDPNDPWASVYPNRGEDDGRFYLYLDPLTNPYARTCRIVAYDPSGKELGAVYATQLGTEAHITVDNLLPLSSSSEGGSYSIPVFANINWIASVIPVNPGDDVSWVRTGSGTTTAQSIVIDPNTGEVKRFAILRFSQLEDPTFFTDLEIVQLPVFMLENAQLIPIKEFFESYADGVIDDNLKVEGFVTNNRATLNTPDADLYIQDDSGRGLRIFFTDASENTYTLNQKLTVWLTGGTLRTEDNGARYLISLSASNFSTTTSLTGSEATPVEITNLSLIDNYPNTLVTLKDVTFVIPIGTLFNGNGTAAECNTSYLSTVRDGMGNTATLRTSIDFTEKWSGGISDKCYNITALVLPDAGEIMSRRPLTNPPEARLIHEKYNHTLRVRNYADLAVTATLNPYTPITLWYSESSVTVGTVTSPYYWAPKFGNGTFDLLETGDGLIGSRSAYCRLDYSASLSYYGFSKYGLWSAATGGNYWKFSLSTAGYTGNIYLALMLGSFGTAPRYWKVQWSDDDFIWNDVPDSDYELWNSLTTATASASDLSHLYTHQEFLYKLPAGAANKATLHLRLIVTQNIRVTATGTTNTTADTGPSCIFYVGVYENKN